MKENIQNLFPEKKVYVLRNPVNLEKLVISKKPERAANRLLYLGWYIKKKGVYDLGDVVETLVRRGTNYQRSCANWLKPQRQLLQ